MTTTRSIEIHEAAALLRRTADNNQGRGIGGPFVLNKGFSLDEALATLTREGVTDRSLCIRDGLITLIVQNPVYGSSHLYINPRPPVTDPWGVTK